MQAAPGGRARPACLRRRKQTKSARGRPGLRRADRRAAAHEPSVGRRPRGRDLRLRAIRAGSRAPYRDPHCQARIPAAPGICGPIRARDRLRAWRSRVFLPRRRERHCARPANACRRADRSPRSADGADLRPRRCRRGHGCALEDWAQPLASRCRRRAALRARRGGQQGAALDPDRRACGRSRRAGRTARLQRQIPDRDRGGDGVPRSTRDLRPRARGARRRSADRVRRAARVERASDDLSGLARGHSFRV